MKYNPDIAEHRQLLAEELLTVLRNAGFLEEDLGTRERAFCREHHRFPGAKVRVWTTIVGDAVRPLAKDAIRVAALWCWAGLIVPLLPAEARVFRVGEIDAIARRTLERMRKVYGAVGEMERCRACGAPRKLSKTSGKPYCVALCWKQAADFLRGVPDDMEREP